MKKTALLTLALLLIIPMFSQIRSAYAVSCGYERYQDDTCEVYLEYYPIVPFDPSYPTASEEFPIKFYFSQKNWWEFDPLTLWHHIVPRAWSISVFYRDDCGDSDYVTWKRWYPTSTSQNGWEISWRLSGTHEGLTVGAILTAPDSVQWATNYTKYYKDGYLHVGGLGEEFASNTLWGDTYVEGAGSLGIPNDLAQSHEGHHVIFWVHVRLAWVKLDWLGIPEAIRYLDLDFYLGDDDPSDTDCWLTVEQGNTGFSLEKPSSGGGGSLPCPTLFVWNGTGYVDYGVIDIHNPLGEDVVREVPVQMEDVGLNNHKATFRLREGWEGLTFSESVIDQVKLYAIGDYGNRYLCPLISAEHSRLGNVLPQLLLSDDVKAQILLLETIDLTFIVPCQNVQSYTFTIEGCNMLKM